jgi:hypothetical protein
MRMPRFIKGRHWNRRDAVAVGAAVALVAAGLWLANDRRHSSAWFAVGVMAALAGTAITLALLVRATTRV